MQISFTVTEKLISVFVFARRIVQSFYFLNPKFQASRHLLWLYSLVYVRPGRKPECWFSYEAAHLLVILWIRKRSLFSEHFFSYLAQQMVRNVFIWVEALRPSQQFFSHVGMFSWVEPVLLKDITRHPWWDSNPWPCDESGTLPTELRRFFFYFLVYGSSYPNFCILEKKKILFLTFFIFSDVKTCQI